MLVRLTKTKRWRTGWLLALTYLLCSLTPTVSVAMSPSSPFVHCMTGDMPAGHNMQTDHMHMMQQTDASNASHDGLHHSHKPSHGQCCCGVMCLPALPASLVEVVKPETPTSLCDPSPFHAVAGEAPQPRYRPPIA